MRVRTKDDGLGPMRDGDVLRVRMSMMDLLDAIQREVASDLVTDRPRVRAADGSVLGLHRPGARLATGVDPLVLSGNARDRAEFRENGRYVVLQMAEVAIPRQMFQEILRLIAELRPQPPPAPA